MEPIQVRRDCHLQNSVLFESGDLAWEHAGSVFVGYGKCKADLDPIMIAHRSRATRGRMLVDPEAYHEFLQKKHIRDEASPVAT